MIAQLRGVLVTVASSSVVLDVHGVGYAVALPERTALSLREGEETVLHTSMIVREDEQSLTGFTSPEERDLFDLLRSVSGVGPKSALGVLNELTVDQVAQALGDEDDAVFRKVSGIGPKTAKLIVLTLQGKIAAPHGPASTQAVDRAVAAADQNAIVQALIGLGWSERVAKKGVQEMVEGLPEGESPGVPELVRRALQLLGPQTSREDLR
jgi:Holliday junction DNA helicase RuvA